MRPPVHHSIERALMASKVGRNELLNQYIYTSKAIPIVGMAPVF